MSAIERFDYPANLVEELGKETRRRVLLWLLFLSPFWGLALYFAWNNGGSLGVFIAAGATVLIAFFEWLLRRIAGRTRALVGQTLEYDGRRLRQIAPDRSVIREIELTQPFEVTYSFSAGGNAIYRATQATAARGHAIEFSSRIGGAERLVREILKYDEWPPGADAT